MEPVSSHLAGDRHCSCAAPPLGVSGPLYDAETRAFKLRLQGASKPHFSRCSWHHSDWWLNVSNITLFVMHLEPGLKEMRCSERAGPCGLHAGGAEKEKRQEGLCQMWDVNKETEGAGRERGEDAQIGKGHRQQLIMP